MKALVIAALALMFAVSGCSGKKCCHSTDGKGGNQSGVSRGDNKADGGAQWSGERADEGATVQFSSAATFNKLTGLWDATPDFTFFVYEGNIPSTAAGSMEIAFENKLRPYGCRANSPGDEVEILCHRNHLEYIRIVNHETSSSGTWQPFMANHNAGGLRISAVVATQGATFSKVGSEVPATN